MSASEPAEWQPDAGSVRELAGFLKGALDAAHPDKQKHATEMLTEAKLAAETPRYLAYILTHGQTFQLAGFSPSDLLLLRSSAAINLKNTVRSVYPRMDTACRDFVKQNLLENLRDEQKQVRNLSGSVITEIVERGGVLDWPQLLPHLLSLAADQTAAASQEGAVAALSKICEDHKEVLVKDYNGQNPLHFILPRLLDILRFTHGEVRALALNCLNSFISQGSTILADMSDDILKLLFSLLSDPDPGVREALCHAYVLWVDVRPQQVEPYVDGLVPYMCQQQRDIQHSGSALEAAEFWLALSENDGTCARLEPHLDKVVPLLLDSMVYDEDNILRLGGDVDDADQEDDVKDIKPTFAKQQRPAIDVEEGEVSDSDDDDDGDWDIDFEEQWNLRKCSAAALDVLASKIRAPVFELALQYLSVNLMHADWPRREAAVLAMGAVAEGCLEAMAPALPNVIPYMTSLLDDPEPAVRAITCWALGRYSPWALKVDKFFEPILSGILTRMLDNNKKVQEAAVSAFASIAEKAKDKLAPHWERIIDACCGAFAKYKDRNMYILYDCVETLFEYCFLSASPHRERLMAALIERWCSIDDQSQEVLPLHECLAYAANALGSDFAAFAPPLFARCARIIQTPASEEFSITGLDLVSAIVQAVSPHEASALLEAQSELSDLILMAMQDASSDVRQSAYAVLGDLAMNVYAQIEPRLSRFLPTVIQQIDIKYEQGQTSAYSVINNACWACGEIMVRSEQALEPYINELYGRLKGIIDHPKVPVAVGENAVITLGRAGIHYAPQMAPHLADFVGQFLQLVGSVAMTEERAHAFLGLNNMIMHNPYAMGQYLPIYLQASVAYSKEEIGASFQQVIDGYKANCGAEFSALLKQMSAEQHQALTFSYSFS